MQYWSPFRAHAEWMAGLREFIYGNGHMEPEHVSRDDKCEIGAWLYGDGKRYRHLREYEDAREVHAELHRHAGDVVILVRAGHRTEAGANIAPGPVGSGTPAGCATAIASSPSAAWGASR